MWQLKTPTPALPHLSLARAKPPQRTPPSNSHTWLVQSQRFRAPIFLTAVTLLLGRSLRTEPEVACSLTIGVALPTIAADAAAANCQGTVCAQESRKTMKGMRLRSGRARAGVTGWRGLACGCAGVLAGGPLMVFLLACLLPQSIANRIRRFRLPLLGGRFVPFLRWRLRWLFSNGFEPSGSQRPAGSDDAAPLALSSLRAMHESPCAVAMRRSIGDFQSWMISRGHLDETSEARACCKPVAV